MEKHRAKRSGEKTNRYWLSANRRKELKYFCLQYYDWMQLRKVLEGQKSSSIASLTAKGYNDYVAKKASILGDISRSMQMIERAAKQANNDLSYYILMAVTKGYSYKTLVTKYEIEIVKDIYDHALDKFYWILSNEKGL